jgi:pilus assembly protein TadC
MLNEEEKRFMAWWEDNRNRKNRLLRFLYVGLPLGVVVVVGIFINFAAGWYSRASMAFSQENSSLFLVLLVAALGIVVFFVIFSARHRWDQHEQHYRELRAREDKG